MKILLLAPDQITKTNWGHQLFRNEIARQHQVIFYGGGYFEHPYVRKKPISQVLKETKWKPDIILTHHLTAAKHYVGLDQITNIPKVHICVDHRDLKNDIARHAMLFADHKYDLIIVRTMSEWNSLRMNPNVPEKRAFLPWSVDTNIYYDMRKKRDIDVLNLGNMHPTAYPLREELREKLVSFKNIKLHTIRARHHNFVETINRSRMFVSANGFNGNMNQKYLESLACGTFFLTENPFDLNIYGLVPEENLDVFKNVEEVEEKVRYYIKNWRERREIAKRGMHLVRENHNNVVRVKEFTRILEEKL